VVAFAATDRAPKRLRSTRARSVAALLLAAAAVPVGIADARRYVEAPDDVPFEVAIEPGARPLMRPALVARHLAHVLAHNKAVIVRMRYIHDTNDPDTGEYLGTRVWIVRATGHFTHSHLGVVAVSPTAYFIVSDRTGMVVGFGMP
jgi:hypothetical protein